MFRICSGAMDGVALCSLIDIITRQQHLDEVGD
jgi:hypothetical protein